MKRRLLGTIILALVPCMGLAQNNDYSKSHAYVYFAPGVTAPGATGTIHAGGGGEHFFSRHVGAGADLAYVAPYSSFSDGIGIFSPSVVARLRPASKENRVEPFVTGGYSLFFRSGTANGVSLGGGANWWFKERVGLRVEVRDNVLINSDETVQFVGFRIGLTFR